MNNIKELQETITSLEKEKDILQEEIAKDMVKNSDLIIQNQNLQQENDKLKEENKKLKQEIQSTEKVVLEIADKLYKQEFNVENIVEVVDNE